MYKNRATPEQLKQDVLVAEHVGWVRETHPTEQNPDGATFWRAPGTQPGCATYTIYSLPHYSGDRNAMASALSTLTYTQMAKYSDHLLALVKPRKGTVDFDEVWSANLLRTTAEQQLQSFLYAVSQS